MNAVMTEALVAMREATKQITELRETNEELLKVLVIFRKAFPDETADRDMYIGQERASWINQAVIASKKAMGIYPDPRDPDHSRTGIFVLHNCARCQDGKNLSRCPTPDRPGNCGYPRARND